MTRINKSTKWTDLGCTAREAKNRSFTPMEAEFIRRYQREHVAIDRMKGGHIAELAEKLCLEPNQLRDDLGSERRKPVSKVGTPAYLNMNGKPRGRPSGKPKATIRHGIRVCWMPIEDIEVDDDYQRALKKKQEEYTKAWDWRACGAITVSYRDSQYWVVDGFQRLNALQTQGEKEVLCVIIECRDKADEAEVFCKCNIDRTQLSSLEKFWAGVIAGSRQHRKVLAIVEKYDFCIKHPGVQQDGCANGTMTSVAKLELAHEWGVLEQLMQVLTEACTKENKHHLLKSFYLGGLGYLLKRADQPVNIARLCKVLSNPQLSFEELTGKAKRLNNASKSMGLGGGGSKYFAEAIADIYNYRLAKADKVSVI